MDFAFTAEHDALRETVRRFLQNQSSETAVRTLMETERGYDPRIWERLATELSLCGLAIPESDGGAGLGAVELAIVMEEMGRVLFCGPYLSAAVLAPAALLYGAEKSARGRLLPPLALGKAIATLAVAEESGHWEPESIAMRAVRAGSGWRLDGIKDYVIDGHVADTILVAARTEDGLAIFDVGGDAPGLTRELLPTLDLTRKLARLTFVATPAVQISPAGDAAGAIARALALGVAMLAAEQAGGAQRCLEMATEYAKHRLQFGRLIGSFQAIQHRCADLLVEVEFARSAAYHAAFAADSGDTGQLLGAAHIAKAYCSEAYFHVAAENIQLHGGIGFTWEHPAHLYFKRARASSVLLGDPTVHRRALGKILEL